MKKMSSWFWKLFLAAFFIFTLFSSAQVAVAGEEVQITNTLSAKSSVEISGNRIVWQDNRNGHWDIYMYDLETKTESQITHGDWDHAYPAISGDNIIWLDWRYGYYAYIFSYNIVTKEETMITWLYNYMPSPGYAWQIPVISGNRIVWSDMYNYIFMYDMKTNTRSAVLLNSQDSYLFPDLSGDKIAYLDFDSLGNRNMYVYDIVENKNTLIPPTSTQMEFPRISGDKVVWQDLSGRVSTYVYDLTSKTEAKITNTDPNGLQFFPRISGNRIVWQDYRFWDGCNIYMYDLLTQTETKITSFDWWNQQSPTRPVISGDKIVWTDYRNGGQVFMYDLQTIPANILPIAKIGSVQTIILGEAITLDGTASNDPDGVVAVYQWNFGDGTNNSSTALSSHIYATAGSYQVTLAVADNSGGTNSVTTTVIVETPANAISNLVATVQDMNIMHGIENSLDTKLQAAVDALSAANSGSNAYAISKLQAFINEAQAQSGKKLTLAQANQLIAAANRIIATLQ